MLKQNLSNVEAVYLKPVFKSLKLTTSSSGAERRNPKIVQSDGNPRVDP
jgi:hypothetical protein